MRTIQIHNGGIEDAAHISQLIPEFEPGPGRGDYEKRLSDKRHLVLIATVDGQLAGFKVGYCEKDYFYSWMGGVIPEFRRRNVACNLAEAQENWVKEQGIGSIRFKTQNRFRAMLIFAIKNGFRIIGTVKYDSGEGFKIILEKSIG